MQSQMNALTGLPKLHPTLDFSLTELFTLKALGRL